MSCLLHTPAVSFLLQPPTVSCLLQAPAVSYLLQPPEVSCLLQPPAVSCLMQPSTVSCLLQYPASCSLLPQETHILSLAAEAREADIYVKVALLEGRRLIKAKKTRLLGCQEHLDFQEQFSILLPGAYLDSVSCLVSLCSKSRFGVKTVLGRTCVGPYAFARYAVVDCRPGRRMK